MSSNLQITFTGDSKSLEAAYQKIQKENVKLREELKKTAEEHKHGGEEAEGLNEKITESIGEQIAELGKMATAWLSIEKALEAVNEEYEHQIELAEKAAEAVKDTGSQRGAVIRNLGPVSGEQRQEFFEKLEEIGLRRGLVESEADQAANYALSATGGDRERALRLVDLAAEAAPGGDGETVGQVARGVEQMRTVTGNEDQRANLGLLFSAQKISPIKDIDNISNYAVPAAMGLTAQGASPEEAFALFSALAKASGDVEGRRTRTAVTNLYGGLQKFFDPESQAKSMRQQVEHLGSLAVGEEPDQELLGRLRGFLGGKGYARLPPQAEDLLKLLKERPELGKEFVAGELSRVPKASSVTDQIKLLQENGDLRNQFFKQFAPESQAKGADIELLRAGSDTAKLFASNTSELRSENYRQAADRQLETIASEPTIQRMQQMKVADVAQEQSRNDFQRADAGAALEAIGKMLEQTNQGFGAHIGNNLRMHGVGGVPGLGWLAHGVGFGAEKRILGGEDPTEVYRQIAQAQIFNLRHDSPGAFGGLGRTELGEAVVAGHYTPQQLAEAGVVKTTDQERLRKARIAEEGLERWLDLRRRETAGQAAAIEEETPATRKLGDKLDKLADLQQKKIEQDERHHRERQASAKQQGARAEGAKTRGRE